MNPARVRAVLLAHVETWRPYTSCYIGLVGLAGAALSGHAADPARLLAAWAIPTLGWLGGLYGGDYFDRELDAKAKPHRPIPSGRMRANTALAGLIGATALGAAAAVTLNWRTPVLVAAALVLGIAYNAYFKARGLSGNAVRGLISAFALLFGAMMAAELPPPRLLPLALVFLAHDTGSNLVGALRDVDGDRAGGYQTLPVRRGTAFATRVVLVCFGTAYATAVLTLSLTLPWTVSAAALLAGSAVTAIVALRPLVLAPVTRRTAYRAHTVIVVERVLLAGALVAIGLPVLAVPLTLLAVLVTLLSQRLLRERHEFTDAERGNTVEASMVTGYVAAQLASLGELTALAGWARLITIRLTEPELTIRLRTDGTRPRVLRDDEPDPELPTIGIQTTGAVFAAIFLTGTSNPRRAYLTRQLSMTASAKDMIRLNQLFNSFLGTGRAPTVVTDRTPSAVDELPATVVISDTTLRDGEQMPGVAFSPATKLAIARDLAALGIPLIEAGFPVVSTDEQTAIRSIVDDELDAVIQVIARPVDGDIDAAIETGAQSVAIFIGTSPAHLRDKLRIDADEARRRVETAVRAVKRAGRQAVFAAEDATRTDLDTLCSIYLAAVDAGADAIGIADTVGGAQPWAMRALVAEVAARVPVPIAVHCHNDLGLATANSIAGLFGGASGVQCSVLGIGERAGNAPLEQVVLALETAFDRRTGLDLPLLAPLAARIAELVGSPIPPFLPVVGAHAFVHESGLHVDGIVRAPNTYEPYPPELIGRQRRIVLGKHSGRAAVLAVAREHGIGLDTIQADELLAEVKRPRPGGGAFDTDQVADLIRARFPTTPTR